MPGPGEGEGCQGRLACKASYARLQQRLAGHARAEHGDRDVGGDEATEEQQPHGQPAAEVGAQPAHALGGAALRVPGEG